MQTRPTRHPVWTVFLGPWCWRPTRPEGQLFGAHRERGRCLPQEDFTTTESSLYTSFYLRVNELPSSDARIVPISNSGTTVGNLQLRSNGALRLRNGSTQILSDSTTLDTGTLYRIGILQRRGIGSNAVLAGLSGNWRRGVWVAVRLHTHRHLDDTTQPATPV